jgi:hypothetical protein
LQCGNSGGNAKFCLSPYLPHYVIQWLPGPPGQWVIALEDLGLSTRYRHVADTEFPPDIGWSLDGGASPAPTLSGTVSYMTRSFMVHSAWDDGDNDTNDELCDSSNGCTLRAAIQQANAMNPQYPIRIWFNISSGPSGSESGGVWTIKPLTQLPAVTKSNVTFDGTTMAGASCGQVNLGGSNYHILRVVLDGQIPPFSRSGIDFQASATGGVVKGFVINNFERNGVVSRADDVTIECMYIGTNYLGTEARPNHWSGVLLVDGDDALVRNSLISGNTLAGIWPDAAVNDTRIEGNVIGVTAGAFNPLPNGYGIRDSGSGTIIGGTSGYFGTKSNVIASNSEDGIRMYDNTSTVVFGNAVYNNGHMGIDLANDGVTLNDHLDGDAGPNDLQNYPQSLFPVYLGGLTMYTEIEFNSEPGLVYLIELLGDYTRDASLHGEGRFPLSNTVVATNGSGFAEKTKSFLKGPMVVGDWITATATRSVGPDAYRSTSEFSMAAQIVGPNVWVRGKVFLEGPYGSGSMSVGAHFKSAMTHYQPYQHNRYDGTHLDHDMTETADPLPSGVVDWVLITLRTGSTPGDIAGQKAAFVTEDGTLTDLDGSDSIGMRVYAVLPSFWIQIGHRNHVSVLSSAKATVSGGVMEWDFTTAGKAYSQGGRPMSPLGSGKYGMSACDITLDGLVQALDANELVAANAAAAHGYKPADCDLDGYVTGSDFDVYAVSTSSGVTSQVP